MPIVNDPYQPKDPADSDEEFVEYVKTTLIPSLHESGKIATAEDFERCVDVIDSLKEQNRALATILRELQHSIRKAFPINE